MQGKDLAVFVIFDPHQILLFPIGERTDNILFRMVKFVCDIGDARRQIGMHHAQQIKVDLDLRIIGIFHIFINKLIGYDRSITIIISVYRKTTHFIHLTLF